jgi:glutathione S-transferase
LRLYFAPGACSLAPLIALEEAGADYEGVRLSLAEGEQRRPGFLAINPRGRVPVLIADGHVVTENAAVLTVIAHRFPERRLLPFGDPSQLARSIELLAWLANGVHPAFIQVFRPERFTDDTSTWDALKAGGGRNARLAFLEIEDILRRSGGEALVGDRFSIVDAYALVFWRWAPRLEIDTADYPIFTAYAARLGRRASVQRALAREAGGIAAAAA